MRSNKSFNAMAASAGVGVLLLWAAQAAAAEEYPKAIAQAVKSGVKVVKAFPAASGLTGWVVSQGGKHSIVYTTADKKTLVVGSLVGEDGQSLTAGDEDKHVPKPELGGLYLELEKSTHVVEGTLKAPKSVLYVFVDPNCPYCHTTWQAVQPYEKAGLQVRWIPVATLGPTSLPKAIEVLAAPDRTAAFRKMEANHGKPWTASASASEARNPAIAAAIAKNGELMEKFGLAGTPGLVWKDKNGKVQLKGGMPRLSELPAMTGLPEQAMGDPSLARFR